MTIRIVPRSFNTRIGRRGGKAVILGITDIEGVEYFIPIVPEIADEVGRQLLGGALALNGSLR
ncbi:hypothetical protein [Mycolicibacterium fluoranthenivorans]|uniref:Uncharacterized protein n=1 Tax=Mycolicibacterium fluoranthenivorans TaxID=258505 RepID=A0A7X5TZQ6_9MYCO|nr:hypothetical protein [Mycolicibacterium fluoranthenivorans]MCV7358169.1 hypothetical protein [Mycolicibacterium fluoranthenivorans]NIH95707.1 hypothetical protein [Mycolicibacterium fluoranthenivorans]